MLYVSRNIDSKRSVVCPLILATVVEMSPLCRDNWRSKWSLLTVAFIKVKYTVGQNDLQYSYKTIIVWLHMLMDLWPHPYWNLITCTEAPQWKISRRRENYIETSNGKSSSFSKQITSCSGWSPRWEHFYITHFFLLAWKVIGATGRRLFAAQAHECMHTLSSSTGWSQFSCI